MTWTYELEQQRDRDGNLIPLWNVTQWNTDDPNTTYMTTITDAVKQVAYTED